MNAEKVPSGHVMHEKRQTSFSYRVASGERCFKTDFSLSFVLLLMKRRLSNLDHFSAGTRACRQFETILMGTSHVRNMQSAKAKC